jgi:hypothetical protein
MPAEGGEETPVLPTADNNCPFDMTERGIYFFERDHMAINRLDLATGRISKVATLDKRGNVLTVSPDDAFVVWDQMDRNTYDLMLVENFR